MKKLMAIFAVIALVAFAAPALAANPFMDVPAGHWAYDAVSQLAARGLVRGYPDGSYKGAQPATRYEVAAIVARVLASSDAKHASAQDIELLKKLVLEFKNELDALGVKVNELDKRVAVLEDGVGGWKMRGIFRFDAKFGGSDDGSYSFTNSKENQFTKERFRLFLTKDIDENSYFYAQYRVGGGKEAGMGDAEGGNWSDLYVDTKIFWDMSFRVGRFEVNFEDDYGLYDDNDALFGDFSVDGFRFSKSFGNFNAAAVVGRNSDYREYDKNYEYMSYALDLSFTPNEKFFVGASGYWFVGDSVSGDVDITTYGVYTGYSFTPNIAIKGIYYFQDLEKGIGDSSPRAWKAALDIKQEALKFTSLWAEYSKEDNNFYGIANRYAIGGGAYSYVGLNRPANNGEMGEYIFAKAKQQWNDKFSTFVRYAHADFNTTGVADAAEWGIGAGYQYTPAIYFELMYDQVDHGTSIAAVKLNGKEDVIRFRTTVNF